MPFRHRFDIMLQHRGIASMSKQNYIDVVCLLGKIHHCLWWWWAVNLATPIGGYVAHLYKSPVLIPQLCHYLKVKLQITHYCSGNNGGLASHIIASPHLRLILMIVLLCKCTLYASFDNWSNLCGNLFSFNDNCILLQHYHFSKNVKQFGQIVMACKNGLSCAHTNSKGHSITTILRHIVK